MIKAFLIAAGLCLLGSAYFVYDLFVGAPSAAMVIVYPVFIGLGVLLAAIFVFGVVIMKISKNLHKPK